MTREQALEKARDFIDKSLEAYESFSGDLPTDLADVILAAWQQGMEEAAKILVSNHPDGESFHACDIECSVEMSLVQIRKAAKK